MQEPKNCGIIQCVAYLITCLEIVTHKPKKLCGIIVQQSNNSPHNTTNFLLYFEDFKNLFCGGQVQKISLKQQLYFMNQ